MRGGAMSEVGCVYKSRQGYTFLNGVFFYYKHKPILFYS
jgi:hypothetical protein